MNARPELYLTVSLDVEEEGLFGGQYARRTGLLLPRPG